MIDDYRPADPHRWLRLLRSAFNVSDLVSDKNLDDVIARNLLTDEEARLPETTNPPFPPRPTFEPLLIEVRKYVAAFKAAANAGELDLPLSGFGRVVAPTDFQREHVESVEQSALAAVREHIPKEDQGYKLDTWLKKVWEAVESAVDTL
jgi:hypothetical protein